MSHGSIVEPRKETVYDGPEVDLFKPKVIKEDRPQANIGKETIHDGDVPEYITRKFSKAQLAEIANPKSETVHHGPIPEMFAKLGRIAQDLVMPDRETIYSGPDLLVREVVDVSYLEKTESGNAEPHSTKETVFDETTFIAKKVDTSASRSLVTRMVQRASVRFFAVAALSLIELYICRNNLPVAISSGIMFLAFSTVGFYTFKLKLKALLFAIGLYSCSTLFMAYSAIMNDAMFVMMVPLFSRGFMIYNLLRTYGLLVDLHLLEAEMY